MITRRDMLRASVASLLSTALLPARSRGQLNPDARLVIVLAYGGWDPMWVFDPKPDAMEVDAAPGDVQWFGDLPVWTSASRPAVTRFFAQWGSSSAIVNGVGVRSLAHETCIRNMLTGGAPGVPDIGARVANALGQSKALPYLTLAPHARLQGLEAQAGALGVTNQLMSLSTPELNWPRPGEAQSDVGLAPDAVERRAIQAFLERQGQALDGSAPRSARVKADYLSSLSRAEQLTASARSGGFLSDYTLFQATEARWTHVAAALAEGISQVALVQPDIYWDTHAYNAIQGDNFEQFFSGLNALMEALRARQLTESTTVLVLSEMGRTPQLNQDAGKDHWPWTSALVVGPRVRGGRTYGQTDEWLRPAQLDLITGMPAGDGVDLHPEHVLGAVAQMMGVQDTGWFGREAFSALVG